MTPKQKRVEIKRLLHLLNEDNRYTFNRMYAPNNLDQDVDLTVDNMPAKRLSWALQQCQNSYYRLFKVIQSA